MRVCVCACMCACIDCVCACVCACMAVFQEAVTGEVAAGHDEFQQGVKRAVPLGWVFKAFPQSHNHVNADLVVQALLQEAHVVGVGVPGA